MGAPDAAKRPGTRWHGRKPAGLPVHRPLWEPGDRGRYRLQRLSSRLHARPAGGDHYISKHDNQTLFDINVFAAPQGTSMAERVRMQNVGLSTVLLGQGVPFLHAGSDLLRSKSLDRDSTIPATGSISWISPTRTITLGWDSTGLG
jgi:pullulanase/glycogen debranching enzyme